MGVKCNSLHASDDSEMQANDLNNHMHDLSNYFYGGLVTGMVVAILLWIGATVTMVIDFRTQVPSSQWVLSCQCVLSCQWVPSCQWVRFKSAL